MNIDLRSDTVTLPSAAMRAAMASAPVGDDVYGEDPTVNRLQDTVAELLGKEAALFVPSGTQSNLIAMLSHCQRGDEYIVGQTNHTYLYEAGGAAVLGSIQPQPLTLAEDGTLPLDLVLAAIKPDDEHYARSRLLCLENTSDGRVLPLNYIDSAGAFAQEYGLALHLDGARLFNAVVKLGIPVSRIAAPFDSVSVCLSKGLGAPVGSCLAGSVSFIRRAHRWRKMVGGGMRQAGILAAAGLYALQHNVDALAADHAKAARLAEGIADLDGVQLCAPPQTNMVFLRCTRKEALCQALAEADICALPEPTMRLVTHRDIDLAGIDRVIETFHAFYR